MKASNLYERDPQLINSSRFEELSKKATGTGKGGGYSSFTAKKVQRDALEGLKDIKSGNGDISLQEFENTKFTKSKKDPTRISKSKSKLLGDEMGGISDFTNDERIRLENKKDAQENSRKKQRAYEEKIKKPQEVKVTEPSPNKSAEVIKETKPQTPTTSPNKPAEVIKETKPQTPTTSPNKPSGGGMNVSSNVKKETEKKAKGFLSRNKKALGWTAAGTTLLGGGYLAYRHHKNK